MLKNLPCYKSLDSPIFYESAQIISIEDAIKSRFLTTRHFSSLSLSSLLARGGGDTDDVTQVPCQI